MRNVSVWSWCRLFCLESEPTQFGRSRSRLRDLWLPEPPATLAITEYHKKYVSMRFFFILAYSKLTAVNIYWKEISGSRFEKLWLHRLLSGAPYLLISCWIFSDQYPGHPDAVNSMVAATDNVLITACEDGIIRAVHLFPHRFIGQVKEVCSWYSNLSTHLSQRQACHQTICGRL